MAFKIGQRIRYLLSAGGKFRYGNWPEGVWTENGMEGSITEVHPKIEKAVIGNEVFEGIPEWATVKFDNGAVLAIDRESHERWEFIKTK